MNKGQAIVLFHHVVLAIGIYLYGFNIGWAIAIFFASMAWTKFVGSDIMHYYFGHGKYEDSVKGYLYTFLTLATGLGSPISFAASHRQHHRHTDTERDPHSPKHIGWLRVYFLDWKSQSIHPRLIADYVRSKFQKRMHKNWFYLQILLILIVALIEFKALCFVLSPFVIYTFHSGSMQNTLGHLEGKPYNAWFLLPFMPWAWDHGDHHSYKHKN
jgi:stearoyl-CoA desaturase (delta-9 desaturase)